MEFLPPLTLTAWQWGGRHAVRTLLDAFLRRDVGHEKGSAAVRGAMIGEPEGLELLRGYRGARAGCFDAQRTLPASGTTLDVSARGFTRTP
jgi:hypothetical protein